MGQGAPLLLLFKGQFKNIALAQAALATPPGLLPEDQFHWAFVTSARTNATSTDISDYNDYVDSAAKALGALTAEVAGDWKAIGSTATVNASTNVGSITHPIYNLAGELVASDGLDLWVSGVLNAIDRNERIPELTKRAYWVWTGTLVDGTGDAGYEVGSARPVFGETYQNEPYWIDVRTGTEIGIVGIRRKFKT